MSEWLKNLFALIFGSNSEIATFVISMIPIIELRGAIPFGSAISFWGENALPLWESFLISLAGSSFICVILTFIFEPFFNWLKKTKTFKKLAEWIERKLKRNSKNIEKNLEKDSSLSKKRAVWLKFFGAFIFVAIPLPLTGVWTGTCLALFIGLSKPLTLLSVLTGNAVAGGLMLIISYFFADNTMIVLYIFLIILAALILVELIRKLILKLKKTSDEKKSRGDESKQSDESKNNLNGGEILSEETAQQNEQSEVDSSQMKVELGESFLVETDVKPQDKK